MSAVIQSAAIQSATIKSTIIKIAPSGRHYHDVQFFSIPHQKLFHHIHQNLLYQILQKASSSESLGEISES